MYLRKCSECFSTVPSTLCFFYFNIPKTWGKNKNKITEFMFIHLAMVWRIKESFRQSCVCLDGNIEMGFVWKKYYSLEYLASTTSFAYERLLIYHAIFFFRIGFNVVFLLCSVWFFPQRHFFYCSLSFSHIVRRLSFYRTCFCLICCYVRSDASW